MKKLYTETKESTLEEQGFSSLIGEVITVYCCRHIYHGKLIEEGESYIKLEDPSIVYETGSYNETEFKDKQSLCVKTWNISKVSVEGFGILNKK